MTVIFILLQLSLWVLDTNSARSHLDYTTTESKSTLSRWLKGIFANNATPWLTSFYRSGPDTTTDLSQSNLNSNARSVNPLRIQDFTKSDPKISLHNYMKPHRSNVHIHISTQGPILPSKTSLIAWQVPLP